MALPRLPPSDQPIVERWIVEGRFDASGSVRSGWVLIDGARAGLIRSASSRTGRPNAISGCSLRAGDFVSDVAL